jgi:hypothetical protein
VCGGGQQRRRANTDFRKTFDIHNTRSRPQERSRSTRDGKCNVGAFQPAFPFVPADQSQATCRLESLPSEIRTEIIKRLPDFATLRSLILASPVYHATYLAPAAFREKTLCNVAVQQLDYRVRVDALAAVRSLRHHDLHSRQEREVIRFLTYYSRARMDYTDSTPYWSTCRSMSEAIRLIRLHGHVKRFADDFCLYVAGKVSRGTQISLQLSKMEEIRLYRAIYRFQIFTNFFGGGGVRNNSSSQDSDDDTLDSPELMPESRFLPAFPPWEVQEIACVWRFLDKRWSKILREISDIYFSAPMGSAENCADSDAEDVFNYLRRTRDDPSDCM